MRKLFLIFISLFFVLMSFAQMNTYLISDPELKIKENSITYYLPRISVNVNIEVETEYTMSGPFARYAEKYLSIKAAPVERIVTSKISNIFITETIEPDPDACFVVVDKKHAYNLSYNNIGVISGYRNPEPVKDMDYDVVYKNDFEYLQTGVLFTDYSVKRNFTGIMDTTYKVIQVDSVFQKIPVYNEVITSKDFEQKAEEAANYIIKIRKRRFKLQSGQFETETPPANVEILIKELDDLEEQYLELFIGKKITIKNNYSFFYIPQKDKAKEKITIFHLSNELGILDQPATDSEPVYFIIENMGIGNELDSFYSNQPTIKDKNKGLYYRIPGHADISIEFDGLTYATKHIVVPQFGYLNYLPSKMFSNKNLKIIFDENFGSIKAISNE